MAKLIGCLDSDLGYVRQYIMKTYTSQFYLHKPVLLTQASSTCASQKLIWIGLKKSRSDFFNPNKSAVLAYTSHIWDTSHILFKWPWEKQWGYKKNRWWLVSPSIKLVAILNFSKYRLFWKLVAILHFSKNSQFYELVAISQFLKNVQF